MYPLVVGTIACKIPLLVFTKYMTTIRRELYRNFNGHPLCAQSTNVHLHRPTLCRIHQRPPSKPHSVRSPPTSTFTDPFCTQPTNVHLPRPTLCTIYQRLPSKTYSVHNLPTTAAKDALCTINEKQPPQTLSAHNPPTTIFTNPFLCTIPQKSLKQNAAICLLALSIPRQV